jgi:predicted dinucleotide-binding enzyme
MDLSLRGEQSCGDESSLPFSRALLRRGRAGATAAASADAARQGDVVVLALPWNVVESAVKALGDLKNKILIDAMNPLVMKDGVLELERGFTTSGGETVASWLPGAKVVKTFNQVQRKHWV